MKITNRANLPAPLVEAVTRHPRERGDTIISVSELIQPPQLRALTVIHDAELEEDASDRIWALLGTLMHGALENHAKGLANVLSEQELRMVVLGWTLVGHYDLSEMVLDGETLTDYKLTSVWSIKDGHKPEWTAQLNTYAHLIRHAERAVNKAQIVAIGRDWQKSKARYDREYPQHQVKIMPVGLWTPAEAQRYIEHRIRLHQRALNERIWPECTEEERWATGTKYALMKKGQKRAVKLYDDQLAAENALTAGHYVEIRVAESRRCDSYCAVADVCPQNQARLSKTLAFRKET